MPYLDDLVSIIVPIHNGEITLSSCIDSVLSQSYKNFELILCIDRCSDMSLTIAKKYEQNDERVKVYLLNNDEGGSAAHARNFGIINSKGRFLAFLDCDDLWDSEKLKLQVEVVKKGYNFIYTAYSTLRNGVLVGDFIPTPTNIHRLKKTCDIGCSTVLIDRTFFSEIKFPPIAKEDYALWLLLFSSASLKSLLMTEKLVTYRLTDNSVSSNKFVEVKRQYLVLRNVLGVNVFCSIFYVACYSYFGILKHFLKYR